MSRAEARAPLAVLAVALCAWLVLLALASTPWDRYLSHEYQPPSAGGQVAAVGLYLGGWVLMSAAMMLPTALLLMRDFEATVSRRPDRVRLRIVLVVGFLAVWAATGYVFRALDIAVHAGVGAWSWLAARPELITGGVLMGAGLFEFSALKHRCLVACRTPRSFIYRFWGRGRPTADAARVGIAYGISCVGCCWALMLVMFGAGTASPWLMLALTAVMLVEKSAAAGAQVAHVTGAVLLAAGTALIVV